MRRPFPSRRPPTAVSNQFRVPKQPPREEFELECPNSLENFQKEVKKTKIPTISVKFDEEKQKKANAVQLVTNIIPFEASEDSHFYSYDIKFMPEQTNLARCYQILKEKLPPGYTFRFDGLNTVLAPQPLFFGQKKEFEYFEAKQTRFGRGGRKPQQSSTRIIMTLTGETKTSPITPSLLQFLHLGLDNALTESNHVRFGKIYLKTVIDPKTGRKAFQNPIPLDEYHVDVCPGVVCSIVEMQSGLGLNLDIANR